MTLKNKLYNLCSSDFAYLCACSILGIAIINDLLWLGLVSILFQYLWFRMFVGAKLSRRRLYIIFFGSVLFMMTLMSWYRFIDAHGWNTIMGLPPSLILMIAVLFVSIFCSLIVTCCWWTIYHLYLSQTRRQPILLSIFGFATGFMLAELVVSVGFSIATAHSAAPIAPTWNIFSITLLVPSSFFVSVSRVAGFWGTAWALCFFVASIAEIFSARSKLNRNALTAIVAIVFLLVGLLAYDQSQSSPTNDYYAAAVSNDSRYDYLEQLPGEIDNPQDHPTVVVLPEYSSLLHPYGGLPAGLGYDARYVYPDIYSDKNIYFVGTENEKSDNKNYVESYVVNGKLDKVKRQVKTFLIPGGEYSIPWARNLISIFDSNAVDTFDDARGRIVINRHLETANDSNATKIGIGACSTLMMPYHFRNEVNDGAEFLTSNVSYEQFTRAPEYQRFATRLARFHAVALDRWMVVGANQGNALVINSEGTVVAKAAHGEVASATIKGSDTKTLYARLGDLLIVSVLIGMPLLLASIYRVKFSKSLRIENFALNTLNTINKLWNRFRNKLFRG